MNKDLDGKRNADSKECLASEIGKHGRQFFLANGMVLGKARENLEGMS